jgi:hypothetical protein
LTEYSASYFISKFLKNTLKYKIPTLSLYSTA